MKIFGLFCCFLLQNTYASPIQTRSDAAVAALEEFLQTIPSLLSDSLSAYESLQTLLPYLTPPAKAAVAELETLLMVAKSVGDEVLKDFLNEYPMRGMRQFKRDTDALIDLLSSVVNIIAAVSSSSADELNTKLSELLAVKDQIFEAVTAAANEAKYGDETNVRKLIEVLDDSTFALIQDAIQRGIDLINQATTAFVNSIQGQ